MTNNQEINVLVAGGHNVGKTSVCLGLARKNIYTASSESSKFKVREETFTHKGVKFNLLDTPGFNNLLNVSEDELKTKELLLGDGADMILHIANARHIFRSLLSVIQLIEFDMPLTMTLNMMDEAEKFGNKISAKKLSHELGVDVLKTVATEGDGVDVLKKSLTSAKKSELVVKYNPMIEEALARIEQIIASQLRFSRGLGILILINDSYTLDWLSAKLPEDKLSEITNVVSSIKGDVSLMVMNSKTKLIERMLQVVLKKERVKRIKLLEQIGSMSTHPVYGVMILALVLVSLYLFIGKLGAEYAVDFIYGTVFEGIINPFLVKLTGFIPSEFVKKALVGEFGMLTMGIGTAIGIILPIIIMFFFAFSFLEDLGYMPRLSVLLNRAFKKIGLNGRAIMPMILGFSCVTMATISTRVLEEKKERMITILMLVLVIPCSAKLSVIVAILAPVSLTGILIIVAVLLGLMLLAGLIAAKVIPGNQSDFIMEIYPLRIPAMKALLFKTYKRSKWFLDEALPFFIYGTFCLFIMKELGLLLFLERLGSPIVEGFLHLPPKFTDAYLLSFFRGEAGIIILKEMVDSGALTNLQLVVSVLVIILAIPCLTNLLLIIKEYGLKFGIFLLILTMPLSILIGGIVTFILERLPINI